MEKSRYSSSDAKSYSVCHRFERLAQVEGYIKALSDAHRYQSEPNLSEFIAHMHDHKGSLCVVWKREPTQFEKNVVKTAWEKCGNEEDVQNVLETDGVSCCSRWRNSLDDIVVLQ